MKSVTVSISEATALSGAIQELSQTGEDRKPLYNLPFPFVYACARTLTKLQEALNPIQEKNQEIFEGQDSENRKHQAKIKALEGPEKDEAFRFRNDKWKDIAKGSIEVEIYEFPEFNNKDKETICGAGLTAVLLSNLAPMNLCLNKAA